MLKVLSTEVSSRPQRQNHMCWLLTRGWECVGPAGLDSNTCCQCRHHSQSGNFFGSGSRQEVFAVKAPLPAAGICWRGAREPLLADWQMIRAPRGSSCHGLLLDSFLTHLGVIDRQTEERSRGVVYRCDGQLEGCVCVCVKWVGITLEKVQLKN